MNLKKLALLTGSILSMGAYEIEGNKDAIIFERTPVEENSDPLRLKNQLDVFIRTPDDYATADASWNFVRDFDKTKSPRGLDEIASNFCKNNETLTLYNLSTGGIGGQITRPLQKIHLTKDGEPISHPDYPEHSYVFEKPHAPRIYRLEVYPNPNEGEGELEYRTSVAIVDEGLDLDSFVIAIDGTIHAEGKFISYDEEREIQEKKYRESRYREPEQEVVDMRNMVLGACSYDGERYYELNGDGLLEDMMLPSGKHELILYVQDKRGNRGFAKIDYEF